MHWKNPPKIKIYEALGALADGRLREEENERGEKEWRLYSSSGNKFYLIKYDAKENAIMTNDNGSYWQGYLGYPAIAFLMSIGKIKFQKKCSEILGGIKWKDVNVRFKNDYQKTIEYCQELVEKEGESLKDFLKEVESIDKQIKNLKVKKLGKRLRPPAGY